MVFVNRTMFRSKFFLPKFIVIVFWCVLLAKVLQNTVRIVVFCSSVAFMFEASCLGRPENASVL